MRIRRLRLLVVLAVYALATGGCRHVDLSSNDRPSGPAATVNRLADQYYDFVLAEFPHVAYLNGVEPTRHDGIQDNSLEKRRMNEAVVDDLLRQLKTVNPTSLVGSAEWITYAYLEQALNDLVSLRACRAELWNINQIGWLTNVNEMAGWHLGFAQIAELQPVGTPEYREQSLARWSKLASFIGKEVENLRHGLELGFSAPKAVVQRVITQLDGQLSLAIEDSPYYSPATRDGDVAFASATRKIVVEQIYPALQAYRDFLRNEYLGKAREQLSATANPNGFDCYEASLRSWTTMDRSGEDVFELGQRTVAANKASVIELGKNAYAVERFEEIIGKASNDFADRFAGKQELLEFSRGVVDRAEAEMPRWVAQMPSQGVEVIPFPEHEEGTGMSAHYRAGSADRPGEYRIPLHEAEKQSRGQAEIVAFHETWPGHHLQDATAQSVEGLHPINRLIWFSGPGEGWARYSEGLAEEMGLYETLTGPIIRRAWPARGMVVDPGIHLLGWSREEARMFMAESGRYVGERAEEMIDRIAILPGQLTAYDSGGLEISALRRLAEDRLGADFDVRDFHIRVLENGTIPLNQLRAHIEGWIAKELEQNP